LEAHDIFSGPGSVRRLLFRVYVNDVITKTFLAAKFLISRFFQRFYKKLIWAFAKSPFVALLNPLIFYIQVRLMGLKLRVDFTQYELSWRTLFSAHSLYYCLLQIENVYSFLYSLKFYKATGPATDYVPEKPSAPEMPI